MSKVFKEPDSYISRVLKRFISRMNLNNYEDGEQPTPPGPEPTSLTPFSTNQTITGIDFGDVQNGDTNDALDAFLAGLTYDQGQYLILGSSDDMILAAGDLGAMTEGSIQGYILQESSGDILYSTVAADIGVEIPKGYQNLTDGKYSFDSSIEVSTVSSAQGWNGTLIGAVEGETPQPTGLIPVEIGDKATASAVIKVNLEMSTSDINAIISDIPDETSLITYEFDEHPGSNLDIMVYDMNESVRSIIVADVPIYYSDTYEEYNKDTDTTVTYNAGWQHTIDVEGTPITIIDQNGVLDFSAMGEGDITVAAVDTTYSGWNGVIIGAVTE